MPTEYRERNFIKGWLQRCDLPQRYKKLPVILMRIAIQLFQTAFCIRLFGFAAVIRLVCAMSLTLPSEFYCNIHLKQDYFVNDTCDRGVEVAFL